MSKSLKPRIWLQYKLDIPVNLKQKIFLSCHVSKNYFRIFGFEHLYLISSVIRQSFFLPKQSQRSRSILLDGSRSLGSFRKGKIGIIAKFYRTNLVIRNHFRGTKTPSYSRINTVCHTGLMLICH